MDTNLSACALSLSEMDELARLEATVKSGLSSFVAVGQALLAIRDKRLYRAEYANFETYCQVKWQFSRRRAGQLIEAASVALSLPCEDGEEMGNSFPKNTPASQPVTEAVARELSKVPTEKRREVLKKSGDKPTAATVRRVAAAESQDQLVDENGTVISDPAMAQVFLKRPAFTAIMREISALKTRVEELAGEPAGRFLNPQQVCADLENARAALRFAIPHAVCPYCGGQRCESCKQTGWLPEEVYNAVPADLRQ